MKVATYLQPSRTYLPCTGVGRYINNVLLRLSRQDDITLSILVAQEYLHHDGKLDPRTPLRDLPLSPYPYNRLLTERLWKLVSHPKMDRYIGEVDCFYSPVAEYIPFKRKLPSVITMHDMHTLEPNLPWSNSQTHKWQRIKTKIWIRKVFEQVDHICTVSNFSKQRIIELLNIDPQKITVTGVGIDESFFNNTEVEFTTLPDAIKSSYVIVIGGLRDKKGGMFVLNVARELQQRNKSLKIVVVGTNEAPFDETAKTFSNMLLLNVIPDKEMLQLLKSASALLFLSPYEGFGIPMVEAMAMGVPAIVANRGALPDVGGKAAILVEPEDTGAIVDVILSLEDDSQLHAQYSRLGQEHAKKFTWNQCINKVVNVLKNYCL